MVGEVFLPGGGWSELLLEAADFPSGFSVSFHSDLRWLFLRRWVDALEQVGCPVLRRPTARPRRCNARIVEVEPLRHDPHLYKKPLDAGFCFTCGTDDYSYQGVNYRIARLTADIPANFVRESEVLSLGNFAIGLKAPPSGIAILPPPELSICGYAECLNGRTQSSLIWLGVRYVRSRMDHSFLPLIENAVVRPAISGPRLGGYIYGSVFSQYFAQTFGDGYVLSEEEEARLRAQMGYPTKGKGGVREKILYDSACLIFGSENVRRRYRGKELEGLELDVWIPSHRLALEYQGEQHFQRIAHWHGKRGFEAQQKRDARKRSLCKELGYRLMLFGPRDRLDRQELLSRLRKNWWI
jgi:hypothetical protein